jgi:hypothetical protein
LENKTLRELVPGVEVTLVSKFHLIWSIIAQESSFRKKVTDFGKKNLLLRPPTGLCPLESFSPTLVHCFGYIFLIGDPIDPILLPLRS